MHQEWINAIIGGLIIGTAVSLLLLFNGRVTGISGIINGACSDIKRERTWRILFVLGLLCGGIVFRIMDPSVFNNTLAADLWMTALSGLLVGFGTILGSGCTSGHGICGVSRLSRRSILATFIFICSGAMTVFIMKKFGFLI